jgi:hypothetical protein
MVGFGANLKARPTSKQSPLMGLSSAFARNHAAKPEASASRGGPIMAVVEVDL